MYWHKMTDILLIIGTYSTQPSMVCCIPLDRSETLSHWFQALEGWQSDMTSFSQLISSMYFNLLTLVDAGKLQHVLIRKLRCSPCLYLLQIEAKFESIFCTVFKCRNRLFYQCSGQWLCAPCPSCTKSSCFAINKLKPSKNWGEQKHSTWPRDTWWNTKQIIPLKQLTPAGRWRTSPTVPASVLGTVQLPAERNISSNNTFLGYGWACSSQCISFYRKLALMTFHSTTMELWAETH